MELSKCCIVNVGVDGWYPKGSLRLANSLDKSGWKGQSLIYVDNLPANSETHEQNPYSFKIHALREAISLGYEQVLWLDSSIYTVKNPEIVFQEMKENKYGMTTFLSGYNVSQTATDSVLKYANVSRDDAEKMCEYASGAVGFDLTNPIAKKVWLRWKQYMEDGQFKNSRHHDNQSEDPRFLFGRQDQTALSLACHEYGVEMPQSERIAYNGRDYNEDKIVFLIQGL